MFPNQSFYFVTVLFDVLCVKHYLEVDIHEMVYNRFSWWLTSHTERTGVTSSQLSDLPRI